MFDKPLCFVDIETTGSSFYYDQVIELAVIRVEKNRITEKFTSLFNPNTRLDPFISRLTGIRDSDLEDAPQFDSKIRKIEQILDGAIFVAHNSQFDYNFLKNEFRRRDKKFKHPQLCTVKLARKLFPNWRHYNLDALIENLNLNCPNRHRAEGDAGVLFNLMKKIKKDFSVKTIQKVVNEIMKHPSVPMAIPFDILDNLPENPGVYVFYGEDHLPLYVGKSINIRGRVLDHFSGTPQTIDYKLAQLTREVEHIETAGELSALLLESAMVKDLHPMYNRQLRYARKLVVLKKVIDKSKYLTVEFCETDEIAISDITNVIGVFRSHSSAKKFLDGMAVLHKLCPKILGLEKGKGQCFHHQIDKCNGACIGKEKPASYNLRFVEAFYQSQIKSWPFKGPVVIHEKLEKEEHHLFDQWCYLGSLTEDGLEKRDYRFDYDTYRILARYLKDTRNWGNVMDYK